MRSKKKKILKQKVFEPEIKTKRFYEKSNYWIIGIVILTALAYFPGINNELTNWDDPAYISENPYIKELSWQNTTKIFSENYIGNYHPLTLLSYNIEYQFSESKPLLYHINNLLLHLLNTFLVFWLINILVKNVKVAAITAVLFGIHPLHVESVVWISERKDVLYTFFFLTSLIAYIKFLNKRKTKLIFFSLLLFLLSLLSKGQAVTLAVSLLAIDYILDRKLLSKKVIIEKIPFFALALLFGVIAINAQKSGQAVAIEKAETFFGQIIYAFYAYTEYIIKLIAPNNLSAIYPYPADQDGSIPVWIYFYLIPFVAIIWFFVYSLRHSKSLAFGIIFFTINIFLLLQLLPVGKALMADRYTYIPSIGIFFIIGIYIDKISIKKPKFKRSIGFIFGLYVFTLFSLTYNRCDIWENSLSLWNDVLVKHPEVPQAAYNRAIIREKKKDFKGAISDYTTTIKNDPSNAEAFNNRGNARTSSGDFKGAIDDLTKAISLQINYTEAYYNRGIARIEMKDYAAAIADFDTTISLNSQHIGALNNRGNVQKISGDIHAALIDYNKVIELIPEKAESYNNRGSAYISMKDYKSAIDDFTKAIELDPVSEDAWYNRGNTYIFLLEYDKAIIDFTKALNINPQNVMAYNNRGNARARSGDIEGAISDYDQVVLLNPGRVSAYFNRAYIKTQSGDLKGALSDLDMAISLNPQHVTAYYLRGVTKISLGQNGCDDLRLSYQMGYKDAEKDVSKYCED